MPVPVITKGTVITLNGVGGGTAVVYKSADISGSVEDIDITDTSDTTEQFMPGLKDHDQVKLTVYGGAFTAGSTVYALVIPGTVTSNNVRIVDVTNDTKPSGLKVQEITLEATADALG